MALFCSFSSLALFFFVFFSTFGISHQQPFLNSAEQESVYRVLDSINSAIPWRSLFADDLCISAPHGVVCDYFSESNNASSSPDAVHITELSFGYVSDFTPNPPCSENSTLSPLLFTSFKYLRKLFFYKCFNSTPVSVPDVATSIGSTLEELVFVDNPAFVGSISSVLRNFSSLRRVVLTGNGVFGEIPSGVGDLVSLEELTLSRNRLSGKVPQDLAKLKKLKILDLSQNSFEGDIPSSMSNLSELLKLDVSSNSLYGRLPESFRALQKLEFLDLSFNHFGNFGVPLFLAEMTELREVYLSGNQLGGQIPNIWKKLGGILRMGFSNLGLEGTIPASMAVHLRNLSYLGLDNNKLEGSVPVEFGLLQFVNEINLENNSLSGKISFPSNFSSRIGHKLKLGGNPNLCLCSTKNHHGSLGKLKVCKKTQQRLNPVALVENSSTQVFPSMVINMFIGLLILIL
ncbi:piriformospora indica-insensitive protein 2 [Humulus lupulus]|uniref:piriformospora indica-insensitive protein 2 n=1 Tax=Humulus lupulus TaxID=3486 RepID=UPI002B41218B|nr:piriformospora indica-insensitive protein 2 [Humulus lupulus]